MSNYPPGVTDKDIDDHFGDSEEEELDEEDEWYAKHPQYRGYDTREEYERDKEEWENEHGESYE